MISLLIGAVEHVRPPLIVELFQRLPVTLELLVASILISLLADGLLKVVAHRTSSRVPDRLISAFMLVLRCLPFFWFVLVLQVLAGVHLGEWVFGWASLDSFSLRDNLAHLVVPACILTVAILPSIAPNKADDALSSIAIRLPEIFAACLIVEIFFARPGEGSILRWAIVDDDSKAIGAIVLVGATLTVLFRSVLWFAKRARERRSA